MGSVRNRVALCILGLTAALAANVAAFVPSLQTKMWSPAWALCLIMAVSFVITLLPGEKVVSRVRRRWALGCLATPVFFYVLVMIVALLASSHGYTTEQRDGRYFYTTHGTIVRELSKKEYEQHRVDIARLVAAIDLLGFACLLAFVGSSEATASPESE